MTVKDRATLTSDLATAFPDNITGLITAEDLRLQQTDVIDSYLNFDSDTPNVVFVSSLADFPAPVGGVIELVPTPGDEIVYEIAALDIDVGNNVFTVTSGEVVIRGMHRTASGITTGGTGAMFTVVDSSFFQEYVAFSCVNAEWVNISVVVPGFHSFANQNVIIRTCDSLGTISDEIFTASFRTFTVVSTVAGGFTWTGGAGTSQINMSNFLAFDWVGTLLDLGTATFSLISIVGNNRFISPAGTTILSGTAANANFATASGRGAIEGNIFNGIGTALSGISVQDTQWNSAGNSGVPDTKTDAGSYLLVDEVVTITSAGVYVGIGGVNWQFDIANRFTVTAAGVVEYIGLDDVDVQIIGTSTIDKVGGGSDLICLKIGVDVGAGAVASDKTIGCTQSTLPTQVISQGLFVLSTGDKISLMVGNEDSTSNIDVLNSNLVIVSK
jgi:hypothetical protein